MTAPLGSCVEMRALVPARSSPPALFFASRFDPPFFVWYLPQPLSFSHGRAMDCFARTSECLIIYIYNRSAKKSGLLLLLKGRRTTYTRKSIMLGILLCTLYYFLTVLHSIRLPIHKNIIHRVTLQLSPFILFLASISTPVHIYFKKRFERLAFSPILHNLHSHHSTIVKK